MFLQVVPFAYAFMQSQHTVAYEAVFVHLRQLGLEIRHATSDFETAIRNALRATFGPNLELSGCVRHYVVCVFQATIRYGLLNLLQNDVNAVKVVRWLAGEAELYSFSSITADCHEFPIYRHCTALHLEKSLLSLFSCIFLFIFLRKIYSVQEIFDSNNTKIVLNKKKYPRSKLIALSVHCF